MMGKKFVCALFLAITFTVMLVGSTHVHKVDAQPGTVYILADGSISPPSANITSLDDVTYTFTADFNASIIVQRSNIVIDGDGWTLGGNSYAIMRGLNLTNISNVTIKNMNILEFGYAVWLEGASQCVISNSTYTNNEGGIWLVSSAENTVSNNSVVGSVEAVALDSFSYDNKITNNTLTENNYGVYVRNSSDNLISRNNMTANVYAGVYLNEASNNSIIRNKITSNNNGVYLTKSSSNKIIENNLTANNGIQIFNSHNNTLYKNSIEVTYIGIDIFGEYNVISGNTIMNCDTGFFFGSIAIYNTISGNIIENNDYGLYFEQTSNNSIVRNHIKNNTYGLYLDWYSINMQIHHNTFNSNTNHMISSNPNKPNFLDNGIEGNYWSNYTGVDVNRDGIGDAPHVIDANNTDHHPLMGMFHSLNTSLGKSVNIISNSTVDNFQYESPSTIRFHVSNTTASQTHGFCRVSIPYEVLSESFNVSIDGANPTYWNYFIYDNGTHRWIYFEYEHSTIEVVIIPESLPLLVMPLFMMATLLATFAYRRRRAPNA